MSEQLPELDPEDIVDETDADWEEEPPAEEIVEELNLDEMGNPQS